MNYVTNFKDDKHMKAIILAAGMGNRLGNITDNKPKALVEIGHMCLIDWALDFLDDKRIEHIAVVGGYNFDQLNKHLHNRKVKIFNNTNYSKGNILSLEAALEFIDDDTLIMNVDHIYPKSFLEHIFSHSTGITAICDFDRDLTNDDMKISLNSNKTLDKISKQLQDFDGGYIGMTFISNNSINIYKNAFTSTLNTFGEKECIENILGFIAKSNHPVNICDCSGYKWLEIDTPEELEYANKHLDLVR